MTLLESSLALISAEAHGNGQDFFNEIYVIVNELIINSFDNVAIKREKIELIHLNLPNTFIKRVLERLRKA